MFSLPTFYRIGLKLLEKNKINYVRGPQGESFIHYFSVPPGLPDPFAVRELLQCKTVWKLSKDKRTVFAKCKCGYHVQWMTEK